MDNKFRFAFYAKTIENKTELKKLFVYDRYIEAHAGRVKVLDFMDVESNEFDNQRFVEELQKAFSTYKRENGENLCLILTNITEDLSNKITQSYELESFLHENKFVIPVFDDYGALSLVMGLPDNVQIKMKKKLDDPIRFDQPIPDDILHANTWFFKKDNLSYVTSFTPYELIKDFNEYIIHAEVYAWRNWHAQILNYHILEYIDSSMLFYRPRINAWWARLIYSKYWDKSIDIIVYNSLNSAELANEVKREFIVINRYIEDLFIDTYKNPYRINGESSLKQIENKNVLIVTDIVITGEELDKVYKIITHNHGIIKGIATVFKNNKKKFNKLLETQLYSLTESPIELYSLDETTSDKKCPECSKTDGMQLNYLNPKTNNLFLVNSTKDDFNDISSDRCENKLFWKWLKESQALNPHILHKNGANHYYYYINTGKLLKKYADKINWDIAALYDDLNWPDTILFSNNSSSSCIVSHLVNQNKKLQRSIILPFDKEDIFVVKEWEKLTLSKSILIVLNMIEKGNTLSYLLNSLYGSYDSHNKRKVTIFMLIDRLQSEHRDRLKWEIETKNIKSIFKISIPTFKYEKEDCPICREIKLLTKHYNKFSYTAKRYVDQRIEVLKPIEIDPETDFIVEDSGKDNLNDIIHRGEILDFIYQKDDTAFFEAIKHGISVEKLSLVLEDIPLEYLSMYDVQIWLSKQLKETTSDEHLSKLLQTTLHSNPSLITPHLERITEIFLTPNRIGFLLFLFEYLICEGVVSKEEFVKPLLIKIGKKIPDTNNAPYRELINSILHTYPEEIIGHPSLRNIYDEIIKKVTKADASVLITGETGTGKERIAKLIHDNSDRRDKPFIAVDTSSVPETLIESELFGHEKGAFTGAIRRKEGKLELADGGTLFLDEISNISLNIQAKLLRVLQDDGKYKYKKFQRLGGKEFVKSDFRLICASNIPIEELVKKGVFRKDLYYRINVIPIRLPSLRDTPEDIPILTKRFLGEFCERYKTKLIKYDKTIDKMLLSSSWDGNVRELRNIIERLVVLSDEGKPNYDLIRKIGSEEKTSSMEREPTNKETIISLLESTGWNKVKAAKKSGRSRTWLYDKMKEYNITNQRQL